MLNDVHAPPLEPQYTKDARTRAADAPALRRPATPNDRAHELARKAEHSEGIDLIYPEPEDRGDAFNTTLSAVVVGLVVVAVGSFALVLF